MIIKNIGYDTFYVTILYKQLFCNMACEIIVENIDYNTLSYLLNAIVIAPIEPSFPH